MCNTEKEPRGGGDYASVVVLPPTPTLSSGEVKAKLAMINHHLLHFQKTSTEMMMSCRSGSLSRTPEYQYI